MERLYLVSVFWQNNREENGEDAMVSVENGMVVYITRADGLEVRLLITELEQVYHFALEQMRCKEVIAADLTVGVPTGGMAGCQSTNHRECYGELWQCEKCGKTVCYAEGSDNDHELCDDCWLEKYPLMITPI